MRTRSIPCRAGAWLLAAGLSFGTLSLAQAQQTGQGQAGQKPAAVSAGVVTLHRGEVPVQITLSGQATAVESASVRPLVDGIITGILYEPGREVKTGTPLFSIDAQTYEASVEAAKASLQSAQAAVPSATSTLERYQKLVGTGATQEQLDSAKMTLAQAEASVAQAQASLRSAQINLDRTTIRSPVTGVPDVAGVSVGDLVTSGQSTALTTVTSLDPINVDLSEASARMLDLRNRVASGAVKGGDKLAVSLVLENGQAFAGTGTFSSVGAVVSTSTGTVRMRFRFDNPDRVIMPGMFVRATITMGTSNAFLVPQMAATVQADGTIAVWLVGADGKAEQRKVTPGGSTASAWIVLDGLEEGDQLMVDNIATMSAGTAVTPIPVTLSPAGIVTPVNAAPDAAKADPAKPAATATTGGN